ncbi:MAG: NAD-dependent epimerase/dehydratase family protein [Candidatus Eremiobacteraeota bacterium]|nr:NAD-dependent epimerase/dehydratase family protein [Candidatus Eremiobacteraeota bacterium]
MNIVVTGAAGFIGSNVADAYIKAGHNVIIIDDLSSGNRENVNKKAEFHHLNINDPKVEDIFKNNKIDVVNHHAAQIDVRKSVADPVFDATSNVLGIIRLLEYCRKYDVPRFIFSSTAGAIYGEPEYIPADEKHPIRPLAPYGVSKFCGERYIQYYHDLFDQDYVILRYPNVYGPRQDPHGEAGVVAIFSGLLLEGKQPKIFGSGEATRDYLFVGEIVRANLIVLDKGTNKLMNLGTGIETSVNDLFGKMRDIIGADVEAIHMPDRPGEVQGISIDASFAKKTIGWQTKITLEEGLARTIDFFRDKMKVEAK